MADNRLRTRQAREQGVLNFIVSQQRCPRAHSRAARLSTLISLGPACGFRRMFRRFSLVSCGASRSHHTQVRVVVVITVSPSIEEIHSQALTFMVMNISVIAAALILGFSADPQIRLQECVYFVTPTYAPWLINILITVPSSLGSSPSFRLLSSTSRA